MAVDIKVNRKLDNNHVQIEATSKKSFTRFFKVPEDKADEFCASYKKHENKMKWLSNISFILATMIGCAVVSPLTRKASSGARLGVGVIAGVIGGTASVFATSKIMENKSDKLLKSFKAEEIIYNDNSLPI